jgi:hypothetical protein
MAGVLDQIIANNLRANTPGVAQAVSTFNAQQDALRMRNLQNQLRENIQGGESLLAQSPIFAQMAATNPAEARQMQSLFSTINKEQVADTFASVPLALSMDYNQATQFWENKKNEYPNNPMMQEKIGEIVSAPPEQRARIYDGMMSLGSSIGVLPKRPQDKKTAAMLETEWYMAQPPEVQATHDKLKRGEQISTEEKMALERAKSELSILETAQKEDIKLGAKELNNIAKDSRMAGKQMNTLDKLDKLNEKAFAGTAAGFRLEVAKLLKPIVDIEGLSETEQFRAIGNELVLDKAQQMSGALSNADMIFLENTAPNISYTREGRTQIIDFARKLAMRQKDYARQAQEFKKDNGYFNLSEFQNQFDQWAENNPLFPIGETQQPAVQPVESAPQPVSQGQRSREDILKQYGL